mgnify:CR=1 FL=1
MDTHLYQVELTFTTELLGTVPRKAVYATYIASKALDVEDELETAPGEIEDRGWTGFHLRDGKPIVYDYTIKGFFKDACGALRRVGGTHSARLRSYKKVIDTLLFVSPRQIPLILPEGEGMGVLERPLRGQTPQGERVTVVRSDSCPAGTKVRFTVEILGEVGEELLREWLDYGRYRGLGQWRNGGYGSFTYTLEAV